MTCTDAGLDDAHDMDTPADGGVCVPELLFQRGGQFTDGKVFRIDLQTFMEYKISLGGEVDVDPEWSPDGTHIALSRQGMALWVVDYFGAPVRQVDSSNSFLLTPQWSPDGSKLAYSSLPIGTGTKEILVAAVDGNPAPATVTPGQDAQGPLEWSPDGTKILFVSNRSGNLDVFSMSNLGANPTNLTNRPGSDGVGGARWSPDGGEVVFVGQSAIWSMNADGSSSIDLTGNAGASYGQPAWSPDGTKIYFVKNPASASELYVMNTNGTNQHSIDSSPALDLEPTPSPDGSRIAWSSRRDGNYEIYVSGVDGANPVRVTNNPGDDTHPRWRPCRR